MKLLIIHFLSVFYNLLPLGSKYSPQRPTTTHVTVINFAALGTFYCTELR